MCCSFLCEGRACSNSQFTVLGTTFGIKHYNSQTQTKKANPALKRACTERDNYCYMFGMHLEITVMAVNTLHRETDRVF